MKFDKEAYLNRKKFWLAYHFLKRLTFVIERNFAIWWYYYWQVSGVLKIAGAGVIRR